MDIGHLWYALAWGSFGAVHSILAAQSVKTRLDGVLGRGYRLTYNGFAVLHLGLVWWFGRSWISGRPLDLAPSVSFAGDGLAIAGLVLIAVALSGYDRRLFMGVSQLTRTVADTDEPLRVDGLHRYMRHPLYTGLFAVLWGQAQTEFALATAVWGSVYLLIGTYFEERRLIALYGDAYSSYRRRVPAFIPWRGRTPTA